MVITLLILIYTALGVFLLGVLKVAGDADGLSDDVEYERNLGLVTVSLADAVREAKSQLGHTASPSELELDDERGYRVGDDARRTRAATERRHDGASRCGKRRHLSHDPGRYRRRR